MDENGQRIAALRRHRGPRHRDDAALSTRAACHLLRRGRSYQAAYCMNAASANPVVPAGSDRTLRGPGRKHGDSSERVATAAGVPNWRFGPHLLERLALTAELLVSGVGRADARHRQALERRKGFRTRTTRLPFAVPAVFQRTASSISVGIMSTASTSAEDRRPATAAAPLLLWQTARPVREGALFSCGGSARAGGERMRLRQSVRLTLAAAPAAPAG